MELYHTIKYVTRRNCTCENYIFIVIAGAFLFVRFWTQKSLQPGWLRISANRTFIFLRQRIFRRNIFSIPAVLEMGVEVFRKNDIFVLRHSSVQNSFFFRPFHIPPTQARNCSCSIARRWSAAFLQVKFVSSVWQAPRSESQMHSLRSLRGGRCPPSNHPL